MSHKVVISDREVFMVELIFYKPQINIDTTYHVEKGVFPWEIFFLLGTFVFIVLFEFFDEVF